MSDSPQLTPYPEADALIRELLARVQAVLGEHLIGMYLEGSLAGGAFDQDSDIDFVAVTDEDISEPLFSALQSMHARIALLDTPWAIQLEGSYIGQHALRRYDPARTLHPNIERGPGERLKMVHHDASWDIHRSVLRERGITLIGPHPHTLIDPISPNDLRRAVVDIASGWCVPLLSDPAAMQRRGYQSFVVLSLCRMLYTLDHGAVVSKLAAARWVKETLDRRWTSLIDRAWEGRRNPDVPAPAEDVSGTLDFISFTVERSRHVDLSM